MLSGELLAIIKTTRGKWYILITARGKLTSSLYFDLIITEYNHINRHKTHTKNKYKSIVHDAS